MLLGSRCHLFSAGLQTSPLLFPPCSKQGFPPTCAPSLSSTETNAPARMGLWLEVSRPLGSQPAVGAAGGAEAELTGQVSVKKRFSCFAVPRYSPGSERSCTRN